MSWVVVANVGLFVWLTGGRILWPGHISWLRVGDTASGYFGWEFFRRGPLTVWPPGASPLFGVGYSSSVVYADSIPLLALPLKFILAFTDVQFQYFAAWLLACFVLQGVFAVKLLRRFGINGAVLVPGALLFSIAPVFLYRMITGGYGHMALAGHFLVLWGLWLVLNPQLSHRRWTAVLLTALLVQFYLFVMVGYFYVAAVCWWLWRKRREQPWRVAGVGVLGNVVGVLVVAYLTGYFMGESPSGAGFGEFRADLLTLIDPLPFDYNEGSGWSQLIADRLTVDYTHEGYGFVGIAVLALIPLAIWTVFVRRQWWERVIRLGILVLPTTLLALSNRVRAGYREIATIDMPSAIDAIFGTVRASGRFIWPLVYVVTLFAVVGATFHARRLRVVSFVILSALLCVQLNDQQEAQRRMKERFIEVRPNLEVISDSAWDREIARSRCIAVFPTPAGSHLWMEIAEYSLGLGKASNAAYTSRLDLSDIAKLNERIQTSSSLTEEFSSCVRLDLATKDLELLHGQLLADNDNPAAFVVTKIAQNRLVISAAPE